MATLAAEFPNDNPALHGGAIWVCLEPTGAPVAQRVLAALEPEPVRASEPERALAPEAEQGAEPEPEPQVPRPSGIVLAAPLSEDEIVVEEMAPLGDDVVEIVEASIVVAAANDHGDLTVESQPAADEPAPVDPVPREPAQADTATEAEPAALASVAADDPFAAFVAVLVDVARAAGAPDVAARIPEVLIDGRLAGDDEPSGAALSAAPAWRAILRGTSDDFSACGAAMLDEWAADVLATLLGDSARAPSLRRELRARGVAAFGLIEAA